MSILTPKRYPVKLYYSTNSEAPQIDRTPNCVQTILKACLVTGYGDKEPAGWSLPFEDNEKGIKVLRPPQGVHNDFYLKLSNDTGYSIVPQVLTNMTAIDNGDLKLEMSNILTYSGHGNTDKSKWVLIASDFAFVFLVEFMTNNNSGFHFYCGNTSRNTVGNTAVALAGNFSSPSYTHFGYTGFLQKGDYTKEVPKLYSHANDKVYTSDVQCAFNGSSSLSTNVLISQAFFVADGEIYLIPAYGSSNKKLANQDEVSIINRKFINHATGITPDNVYFPIDYWEL